jgi:peptidoglycan hydrolase-like protein with peptidoglycan-binding domain
LAAGSAPAAPTTLLAPGSSGALVARVQRALHKRATGRYTDATRRAVVAFQRHDGLLVDGIVGPQTWDALFHITPAAPVSGSAAVASDSTSGGYSIPSSIVECESGGDYSAVNPSSGAGGAYQILPSTWQAYGGQGLPQDASPAEQSQIAAEIYARQGASAWSC